MISIHFLTALISLASLSNALTSTLQQVTGFTSGPTAAGMYVYIPTTKLASAPIIVAIHYCTGSANAYFTEHNYPAYADTYGYIIIYPDAPSSGNCWDVASLTSLTHNAGGDSLTIVNMVKYAVANYGGDITRVYATGSSSGGMMTNVLSGAYPDVFKACTVYSGVGDGCFYMPGATAGTEPWWNATCATGFSVATAQQWGDITRSYYPGYTGSYPRMAIYHGTSDFWVTYANLAETLKQWSNVLGVSFARNITDTPIAGYTKMVYGDGTKLVGFSGLNVGHTVPVRELDDLAWFGLSPLPGSLSSSSSVSSSTKTTSSTLTTSTKPSTATTSTSSKTSSAASSSKLSSSSVTTSTRSSSSTKASTTLVTSTSTTSSVASSTSAIPRWGQCGGSPWTGSTTCEAPYTCVFFTVWYSQCT